MAATGKIWVGTKSIVFLESQIIKQNLGSMKTKWHKQESQSLLRSGEEHKQDSLSLLRSGGEHKQDSQSLLRSPEGENINRIA